VRITNKFILILAYFLAIAGIVHGEDEMSFHDSENDVGMTIFRCDKVYLAYLDNQKKWERLHFAPRGVDLDDGGFAYAVADVDRAYGGLAGLSGELRVLRIKESHPVAFKEILKKNMIENYDPARYRFWGLRILKTKKGMHIATSTNGIAYRLYKDGNVVGNYKTTLELEKDAGLNTSMDTTATLENVGKLPFYVMRLGKTYFAYASYMGLNKWTPLLNRMFKNDPMYFSLEDGETAELQTTALKVNGGKKKYDNAPMFVDSVDLFKKIPYDALAHHLRLKPWEEGASLEEAEFRQYQDNGGQYLIVYLDKKYWVYYEDYSEKKQRLLGKYRKVSDIDKTLKRR
jgi:hypothetical protein